MGHWLGRETAVVCGLALLVGGGYWQGRQFGRWQPLPKVQSLDFSVVPREPIGWTSTDFPMEEKELNIGGIDGYMARHYEHLETGEVITVLILTGQGGPIAVHPPDVCFAGRGYRNESKIVSLSMPGPDGSPESEFQMAVFCGPESTGGHRAQLIWGWSNSGIWSVPANPRLAFARMPRLYKIYVSRSLRPGQDRQDAGLSLELLNALVPEIRRGLSGDNTTTDGRGGLTSLQTKLFARFGVSPS